jgi:hypothetical protein
MSTSLAMLTSQLQTDRADSQKSIAELKSQCSVFESEHKSSQIDCKQFEFKQDSRWNDCDAKIAILQSQFETTSIQLRQLASELQKLQEMTKSTNVFTKSGNPSVADSNLENASKNCNSMKYSTRKRKLEASEFITEADLAKKSSFLKKAMQTSKLSKEIRKDALLHREANIKTPVQTAQTAFAIKVEKQLFLNDDIISQSDKENILPDIIVRQPNSALQSQSLKYKPLHNQSFNSSSIQFHPVQACAKIKVDGDNSLPNEIDESKPSNFEDDDVCDWFGDDVIVIN